MRRRHVLRTLGAAAALGAWGAPGIASAQSWLDKARGTLDGLTREGVTGGGTGAPGGLSVADITAGLREALKVGTKRAVDRVGAVDGFNGDPEIRIPLPGSLATMHNALSGVGLGNLTSDLELRLNRAAEKAAPEAVDVFAEAITQMTIDDAKRIYDGPDDAATQFFRRTMTSPLTQRFTPIVEGSLSEAGAVQAYDAAVGRYSQLPFVPDVKADLSAYVVEKGLDGIFTYVAKEEAAIRANPAARTTDLLQKVFG